MTHLGQIIHSHFTIYSRFFRVGIFLVLAHVTQWEPQAAPGVVMGDIFGGGDGGGGFSCSSSGGDSNGCSSGSGSGSDDTCSARSSCIGGSRSCGGGGGDRDAATVTVTDDRSPGWRGPRRRFPVFRGGGVDSKLHVLRLLHESADAALDENDRGLSLSLAGCNLF